jgi:hypothetical protein
LNTEDGGSREYQYILFGGNVRADLPTVDMQYLVEFSGTEVVQVEAIVEIAALFHAAAHHLVLGYCSQVRVATSKNVIRLWPEPAFDITSK